MPRSQGTSRKGKPSRHDVATGLGRALTKGRVAVRRDPRKIGTPGLVPKDTNAVDPTTGLPMESTAPQHPRSVLEVADLQDFLEQADLAQTEFVSIREGLVVLDSTTSAGIAGIGSANPSANRSPLADFTSVELSVPRRPAWDASTTKAELDQLERNAFYEWRRGIAVYEAALFQSGGTTNQSTIYTSESVGAAAVQAHASSATLSTTTPFERNLDVWRQLWRVLERSACLVQIVDARQPLFYLSTDLRTYASELPHALNDTHGKPMMVLVNKSDYLTVWQRRMWKRTLQECGWSTVVFFSATHEQAKLDAAAKTEAAAVQAAHDADKATSHNVDHSDSDSDEEQLSNLRKTRFEDDEYDEDDEYEEDDDDDDVDEDMENDDDSDSESEVETPELDEAPESHALADSTLNDNEDDEAPLLTRSELIEVMLLFAQQNDCPPDPRYDQRIQFGMVGFPNVGKSSVINVLVGSSRHAHGMSRVAVASQPGKTKHFQTLLLPDCPELMLCDCPGLVFPSLVSQTADLIAAGVYPIAQMRDYWPVMHLICQRIPRDILNAQYGIQIPLPGKHELQVHQQQTLTTEQYDALTTHTSATVLLNTFCIARSLLASFSGVPDHARAARRIVKDYATGSLLYCHAPPQVPKGWDETDNGSFWSQWSLETRRNALAQTKRLREQAAVLLQEPSKVGSKATTVGGTQDPALDGTAPIAEDAIDADLLALIGASAPMGRDTGVPGEKSHKKSNKKASVTPKSKWGKKDRKNRNKDPYGCHATPDGALYEEAAASMSVGGLGGIMVNGKHSQSGYTRPVTFPSAAAAPVKL